MKLSDNEIRDITQCLEAGKPLPDKYRFLLFVVVGMKVNFDPGHFDSSGSVSVSLFDEIWLTVEKRIRGGRYKAKTGDASKSQ